MFVTIFSTRPNAISPTYMCVDVRLYSFWSMWISCFYCLLAFTCLRYIQDATPLPVTFFLLLGKKKCANHEFACDKNTTCYQKADKCDGHPDCNDGSDEEGCSKYLSKPSSSQQSFSCLDIQSTAVLNVFKGNNKDTRMTSIDDMPMSFIVNF